MSCTIVVPRGNSREKNAAMRALGATLIEHGDDFQAAKEFAESLAPEKALHMVPSFHPLLIAGVATYSMELLRAAPPLDVVYVPIGLGSGICGMIAARDALGLATDIVGVVSSHATAYADSWKAGYPVDSPVSTELADGMACRTPVPEALQIIQRGAADIVQVSDNDIARAMRTLFETTHNICEGAGAASYAAAELQRERNRDRKVGVVISGGNIDRDVYSSVISASNGQDDWSR
jgi:threonine dehydratase